MNWINFCNGFVQAAHDYGAAMGLVCTPPGVARSDLVEVFENAASTVTELGSETAVSVAIAAFARAYPCD